MPAEKDTAVFSPMAKDPSPGTDDEVRAPEAALQPAVEAEPAAASEGSPAGPNNEPAEPAATSWEQRAKDTQRALSDRDARLQRLEAQLEVYQKHLNAQPDTARTRDAKADLERLQEDIRNDPAQAVSYVNNLFAEHERQFGQALSQMAEHYESRLAEIDPASKALKESLKAIEDLPGVKFMPMQEKMELVRRMKTAFGGNGSAQMRPPGGVGQQRVVTPQKPPTAEERWAAHLRASGATRSSAPKGVVPFVFEGRK